MTSLETSTLLTNLERLIGQGYVTRKAHPIDHDLLIWNYTPRCQFDRYWIPETMLARGLITKMDGTIVARPFRKFFNLEEHETVLCRPLPWHLRFQVTEKMDGSLGILYRRTNGQLAFATRGSFDSEQAKVAMRIFRQRYQEFPYNPRFTYLFEIIYPENRIVVDYQGKEDLVLLAIIDNTTGEDIRLASVLPFNPPFPVVRHYTFKTLETLRAYMSEHAMDGNEGFVLRFEDGTRVKVKYEEYVRLHKILTNVTARNVWEMLVKEEPMEPLLERVPDEFYSWLMQTISDLNAAYATIERTCRRDVASVVHLADRKAVAERVKEMAYPAIVFKMLDGKDYREQIWKRIKPAATKPFRMDDGEEA